MKIEEAVKLFGVISDKSRLLILKSLLKKAQYVEELSTRFNLSKSTVSFHLSKLEKVGLVSKKKQQYYHIYKATSTALQSKIIDIINEINEDEQGQISRIYDYRKKILKTFMPDGKLVKMPAQNKKRWVVLEEIAKKLDPAKKYSEKEISEQIKKTYPDYCYVRRVFVEEGIFERDTMHYWMSEAFIKYLITGDFENMKKGTMYSYNESLQSLLAKNKK